MIAFIIDSTLYVPWDKKQHCKVLFDRPSAANGGKFLIKGIEIVESESPANDGNGQLVRVDDRLLRQIERFRAAKEGLEKTLKSAIEG
jgi:hypothetical protein